MQDQFLERVNQLEMFMQHKLIEHNYNTTNEKINLVYNEMKNPKVVSNRLAIVKNFYDEKCQKLKEEKLEKMRSRMHLYKQNKEKDFLVKKLNLSRKKFKSDEQINKFFNARKNIHEKVFDKMMKADKSIYRIEADVKNLNKKMQNSLAEAVRFTQQLHS